MVLLLLLRYKCSKYFFFYRIPNRTSPQVQTFIIGLWECPKRAWLFWFSFSCKRKWSENKKIKTPVTAEDKEFLVSLRASRRNTTIITIMALQEIECWLIASFLTDFFLAGSMREVKREWLKIHNIPMTKEHPKDNSCLEKWKHWIFRGHSSRVCFSLMSWPLDYQWV